MSIQSYNGIINIYKEKNFTSHDVVAKMRGICKQKKIGHTGTLDPDATGVLPVCLGSGTKLCDMLTDKDKEYEAEILLGIVTDTQDISGKILKEVKVHVTEEEVKKVIFSFLGEYMQIPPMYSALKVNGKKLYELAREGKEVERKARPVRIKRIEICSMELPIVKIRVECTKGTYIRTLCHDIGEKLNCGATMKSLVRTKVGGFTIDSAITLAELEKLKEIDAINSVLTRVEKVFESYHKIEVKKEYIKLLDNGNSFCIDQTIEEKQYPEGEWIQVYGGERFYGIYAYNQEKNKYKPIKMFL